MSSPAWAGSTGLPTRHAVLAALHVASLIDETGSLVVDARESYWRRAAGGTFGPPDFRLGEQLLLDCGLVERRENRLWRGTELVLLLEASADDAVSAVCVRAVDRLPAGEQRNAFAGLADVLPDPTRREELLAALGRRFDDRLRRQIGEFGERIVADGLRYQLSVLRHPDLARAVRHVSLETDQAGYDISAPRIGGGTRLIEVKATTELGDPLGFFISRNEYETSQKQRNWFLVVCEITSLEEREGRVVGWLPAVTLPEIVPLDSTAGRWESARINVRPTTLSRACPGLPAEPDRTAARARPLFLCPRPD